MLLLLLPRKTISQIHFSSNSNQNSYCCVPQEMKLGHTGSGGEVRAPHCYCCQQRRWETWGKSPSRCQPPLQSCCPTTASPTLLGYRKPSWRTLSENHYDTTQAALTHLRVMLTLRYPPAETSILLSGEKQRSVTQPPWVAVPSSTEIGAHRWRSWPSETFHI